MEKVNFNEYETNNIPRLQSPAGCPYKRVYVSCLQMSETMMSADFNPLTEPLESDTANDVLEAISRQLIWQIIEFLEKTGELEFSQNVNLHHMDQTIEGIFKSKDGYHIAATDNKSGEGLFYDLDDTLIITQDLVWIMNQIELHERGG
jgi:hypothetical protein